MRPANLRPNTGNNIVTHYSQKGFVARNNIKKGDIIVILWKNYCRSAKATDYKLFAFAAEAVKKGKLLTKYAESAYVTLYGKI